MMKITTTTGIELDDDYNKDFPILIATIGDAKDVFIHASNYEGRRIIQ